MYTASEINHLVATVAQFATLPEARERVRGWAHNARMWDIAKNLVERDKCIARAKCFQARVGELTQGGTTANG